MKKSFLVPAGAAVLASLAAVLWFLLARTPSSTTPAASPSTPSPGVVAPEFSLKDISGNVISSAMFRGKPTVINFFATWCPPCRAEIPGFVDVYDRYRQKGLEVVGISLDTDTHRELPRLVMENRIGYRILIGDLATARAYGGVSSIPTTFFVGRDGVIRRVHVGYMERSDFEKEIRGLF